MPYLCRCPLLFKIQHFTSSFSQSWGKKHNHVGELWKRLIDSEKSLTCSLLVWCCRRRRRRGRRGRKTRTAIKRRKIQVNEETEMMISGKAAYWLNVKEWSHAVTSLKILYVAWKCLKSSGSLLYILLNHDTWHIDSNSVQTQRNQ